MTKLLLQLFKPYLTPIEADEIRAEGFALNPTLCFVMPNWPWIEMRGLTEKGAAEFLGMLRVKGVRFKELKTSKKSTKAKVQVSETKTVC